MTQPSLHQPSPRQPRTRARRWLERALLAGGLAALGIWAGSKAIPPLWQAWQSRAFDAAVHSHPVVPAPAARPAKGSLVGRLSIPRLHLSSIVREGDDDLTLSLALGHIPNTALPEDAAGNVGIAGHRDTIFRPLREIRKGDVIRFETLSGTRVYEVDATRVVNPDDVSVLRPNGTSELTLVTCYPFYYVGAAPERFIVSAREMPPAAIPTATVAAHAAALPAAAALTAPKDVRARSSHFDIAKGHATEVAPGISLGLTDTDPRNGSVYGWMWIMPDHRTILIREQPAGQNLTFYQEGRKRELRFTGVSAKSAVGTISE